MSETKKLLAEAQKSIQGKNFVEAIATCKKILKEDKNNSLAFVLLGAAYKDCDRKEAVRYLKLAAVENPKKAYPGLFHCADTEDLPEICEKLLEYTPQKYADIHRKLIGIVPDLTDISQCLNIFSKEITHDEDNERLSSAYSCLVQILGNHSDINENNLDLYQKTLEYLLNHNGQSYEINKFHKILDYLYKQKNLQLLIRFSSAIADHYPNNSTPFEWICKVFCEQYYEGDNQLINDLNGIIKKYSEHLLSLSPQSTLGLMASGLVHFSSGNYTESRDYLLKVNDIQPNWSICLRTLVSIYTKFHANCLAEHLYRRLKTVNVDFVECLVEQNIKEKNEESIKLCKELLPNAEPIMQPRLVAILSKALINNGQYEPATKTISKLTGMNEKEKAILLESLMHRCQGNAEKSLKLLQENTFESSEYYLEFGQTLLSLKQYLEALNNFLLSTKSNPINANCFFWLGKTYLSLENHSKARKCLEKCAFLHPQHEQGIFLLSALYRQNSDWEANSNLLEMAVKAMPGAQCNWARIQLGFHYLGQKNYNEAINSFRLALRSDVDSMFSWEGLADAYLQRGSFTSALKVYQKISELDPTNPYPKLQVANIKTTLRLYSEGIVSYMELLEQHPKYFPALKGITDAHLGLARHFMGQRLLGRCKDNVISAVNFVTEAIMIKMNISCLWCLLASAFEILAALPSDLAIITIPGSLANVQDEFVSISGEKLFEMASRFYCRAIKIRPTDVLIWYELSLNYYLRAQRYGNEQSKIEYLKLATESAKHTIKLSPNNWKNWNLLGIVCTTKEISNFPLAQHCFIKALMIDKKSTVAWTNLGVLYLLKNEIKLANKAFSRAQQSDTGFINAWTGQAYIAELIGQDEEAMDLFKHCSTLGYSHESAISFVHWVCTVLSEKKYQNDSKFTYAIEHMHAIPLALDCITWFCDADVPDMVLESFCFLGYLCYQQRLYSLATKAFKRAVEKADGTIKDKMLCNLGYSHLKNNQPENAINDFQAVSEATFGSTIGLALAHFKASQYEESYSVYESALQWLATDDKQKCLILVAMSAMVYSFQGEKDAKTLLFQCIGLDPPIEGLFSACALGILHEDMQLSQLVLQELKKNELDAKYAHHVIFLTSQFILKTSGPNKALFYLLSKVHERPDNYLIRKVLAQFLLQNYEKSTKHLTASSRVAESSIRLQLKNLKCENSSMEAAKSLAMASEAMRHVDQKCRKKLAQRAVHLNPACKEAWSALIHCNE